MSYDVWAEPPGDTSGLEPNYTANCSPTWARALGGVPLSTFDGALCADAAEPLSAAVQRMSSAGADAYADLAPANGWGNYTGALEFLSQVARVAMQAPAGAVLRICA